jgi:alkaline phosphatase D
MTDDRLDRAERLLRRMRTRQPQVSRRDVVRAAFAFGASSIALALAPRPARAADWVGPRFTGYPFSLGVASGYPRPDGVSLWTRLAPEPLQPDGGMQPDMIHVGYQIASDEKFANVVRKGGVRAVPELAHSVHVDVRGLEPGRWYWYRFTCGDEVSPVGRTRTADAGTSNPDRLRFAVASCQHYEQAYFAAHRHLLDERLDLMLFVGDYIYESNWGDDLVRRHVGPEANTLERYRVRHAQYKTDTDLQALHAVVPWAFTWDDHEVENDYAGDRGENLDPGFLLRRAAAYQAFFEHMPVPLTMRANANEMRIYDTLDYGRRARFYLVDNRQYRDPQVCPDPYKGGGSSDVTAASCPEVNDRNRSMIGAAQERWLDARFAESRAQWNVISQQTIFSRFGALVDGAITQWTDGWDGYPEARERVLASIERHKLRNPLILGGDIHSSVIADVRRDFRKDDSRVVAAEFCSTSIASQGWDEENFKSRLPVNPHVKFGNSTKRGYIAFELGNDGCDARLRVLDNEKKRDSGISTLASFRVEDGKPGVAEA